MRNKFNLYIFILISFVFFQLPIISSVKILEKDTEEILGTEYLYNLPSQNYIIGPGDKLKIVVSREYEELTTIVDIDGEGTINLPKLNRVYVKGLNLYELSKLLNKAFKEYIKYPSVEVAILDYRPIRIFVDGEVNNPGVQTLKGSYAIKSIINKKLYDGYKQDSLNNINEKISTNSIKYNQTNFFPTVFDALRESGGITLYSDLSKVQIVRKDNLSNGGDKITAKLNIEKLLLDGDSSQNIRIYDSDTIKVYKKDHQNSLIVRKAILSKLNPKFLNVMVTGRINTPGKTMVARSSTLNDAIDMAGGAKILKGPVTFVRFNNDGTIDKRIIKYRKSNRRNSYRNPTLKNGDFIFVGESALTSFNQITNEITQPFIGIFSTYGLIKSITE